MAEGTSCLGDLSNPPRSYHAKENPADAGFSFAYRGWLLLAMLLQQLDPFVVLPVDFFDHAPKGNCENDEKRDQNSVDQDRR